MATKQRQVKTVSINPSKELLTTLNITKAELTTLLSCDNYISFSRIKKNGNKRWIDAPTKRLKSLQKIIMYKLLYTIAPHPAACGFIVGRGPIDGAIKHYSDGKKVLLSLDLDNYFPTIKYPQVIAAFYFILHKMNAVQKTRFDIKNDSIVLTELCTYKLQLPQGAPSSPALANIITKPLDIMLSKLAKSNDITYTRYADDITFSSKNLKFDMDLLLSKIKLRVQISGFLVNNNKTRVLRPHRRQSITGIVINDVLGVSKPYYKNTRAAIHNITTGKTVLTDKKIEQLEGRISWISSINGDKGKKLINDLEKAKIINRKNRKCQQLEKQQQKNLQSTNL